MMKERRGSVREGEGGRRGREGERGRSGRRGEGEVEGEERYDEGEESTIVHKNIISAKKPSKKLRKPREQKQEEEPDDEADNRPIRKEPDERRVPRKRSELSNR